MPLTADAITERRQLGIKMIKYLEGLPRPRKWQETRHFTLQMNPNISYLDHMFIENLNKERDVLHNSLTGASKSGDSQFLLSMPDFIYAAIIAIDPPLQNELNDSDKRVSTKAWKKLANALPMYKLPRSNL